LLVPGDPAASAIVERVASTGIERMPPDGATWSDEAGAELIRAWVSTLASCE
jgi:hypothetical protein